MVKKKTYALIGTGGRSTVFLDAIAGQHADTATLVALCDLSPTRMNWHNERLSRSYGQNPVPTFLASDFDKMIKQCRPEVVIVTTTDATHHHYVIRAMELGCDVICEKPLTTTAEHALAIGQAIERTGRNLRVTFNLRYLPVMARVKEALAQNLIGRPTAVNFEWLLNTDHGADYFRRWHASREHSGGLLVHKSTHHFDLINWWLDARPSTVFAMGGLQFYGQAAAAARGEAYDYARYHGHSDAVSDPFALLLDPPKRDTEDPMAESLRGLYLNAEADDGYIRDRNVFGSHVDIEDTMNLLVRYDSGVLVNYSIIAYSPWEGYRIGITGTKGRIEISEELGSHIIAGSREENNTRQTERQRLIVRPMFAEPYELEMMNVTGTHGGADTLLTEHLFADETTVDPLRRQAGFVDGVTSMLVGVCGNRSMQTGRPVECKDLLYLPPIGSDVDSSV